MIKVEYELTEEEKRMFELSRKEDEGTILPEEKSDLDFYIRQCEIELENDMKYQW